MPPTFSSHRYNFDWRGFIPTGVKLIALICSGVSLLQTLSKMLLQEFADTQDLYCLICGVV